MQVHCVLVWRQVHAVVAMSPIELLLHFSRELLVVETHWVLQEHPATIYVRCKTNVKVSQYNINISQQHNVCFTIQYDRASDKSSIMN